MPWRTRSTNTSATPIGRTSASRSLPGMAERTVTISGLSKTFSITGWRLGYCIAAAGDHERRSARHTIS